MYKYIFFDLDGTLIDPKEGITKSVEYALNKFNIYVKSLDDLTVFIGPPLKDSFMEYYHMSVEASDQAVLYYRERFKQLGLYECRLYDNVVETLENLYNMGIKLVIATSKPEEFTIQILKNLNLYKYFHFISGATFDGKRGEKAGVIKYAIDSLKINNLNTVLMVGDRKFDILGAKTNNIDSCGVSYGYGIDDELILVKPNYIINDLKELLNIVS